MITRETEGDLSPLAKRKKERKERKARMAARLVLIRKRLHQNRSVSDVGDEGRRMPGPWNYGIAADTDISQRCCPLCLQAYSDFEQSAVVPCWHCRDKIPLAKAVAVGSEVYWDGGSDDVDVSTCVASPRSRPIPFDLRRNIADRIEKEYPGEYTVATDALSISIRCNGCESLSRKWKREEFSVDILESLYCFTAEHAAHFREGEAILRERVEEITRKRGEYYTRHAAKREADKARGDAKRSAVDEMLRVSFSERIHCQRLESRVSEAAIEVTNGKIVIRALSGRVSCSSCDEYETIRRPFTIDELIRQVQQFIQTHNKCVWA